jgi:hypothetical protein
LNFKSLTRLIDNDKSQKQTKYEKENNDFSCSIADRYVNGSAGKSDWSAF